MLQISPLTQPRPMDIIETGVTSFTVRIKAKANIGATVILVAILVVLVLGIAIASVKISRR